MACFKLDLKSTALHLFLLEWGDKRYANTDTVVSVVLSTTTSSATCLAYHD